MSISTSKIFLGNVNYIFIVFIHLIFSYKNYWQWYNYCFNGSLVFSYQHEFSIMYILFLNWHCKSSCNGISRKLRYQNCQCATIIKVLQRISLQDHPMIFNIISQLSTVAKAEQKPLQYHRFNLYCWSTRRQDIYKYIFQQFMKFWKSKNKSQEKSNKIVW